MAANSDNMGAASSQDNDQMSEAYGSDGKEYMGETQRSLDDLEIDRSETVPMNETHKSFDNVEIDRSETVPMNETHKSFDNVEIDRSQTVQINETHRSLDDVEIDRTETVPMDETHKSLDDVEIDGSESIQINDTHRSLDNVEIYRSETVQINDTQRSLDDLEVDGSHNDDQMNNTHRSLDVEIEETNKLHGDYNSTESNVLQMDSELETSDLLTYMSSIVYLDKDMINYINEENSVEVTNMDKDFLLKEYSALDVVEYELYAEKIDNIYSDSCDTNSSVDEEYLDFTLKKIQDGVIINDTVYLENDNWNSITQGDNKSFQFCTVCDNLLNCNWEAHILTKKHMDKMKSHKPLKKYGLNIIRRIHASYHCAICNDVFTNDEEHISSHHHQSRLVDCISKVDVLLIINPYLDYNEPDNDEPTNDYVSSNDAPTKPISYASIARKPKIAETEFVNFSLANKNVKVRYDSWHMILRVQNKFHCMACNKTDHVMLKKSHCKENDHLNKLKLCAVVEHFKEHLVREINETFYHCAHCNNLQYKHDMYHHIENVHPRRINVKPIDCENTQLSIENKLNVPSDVKPNDTAIIKLLPYDNTEAFNNIPGDTKQNEDRDIDKDTKQVKDRDIDKDTKHVKDRDIDKDTKHVKDRDIDKDTKQINDKGVIEDADFRNEMVTLNIFGCIFKVLLGSFHIINLRPNYYYCGLCQMVVSRTDIMDHIHRIQHIDLLQRTPYLNQFNHHLIRLVRDAFHCTICNVPVVPNLIELHCRDSYHNRELAKAIIGQVPIANPMANVPLNSYNRPNYPDFGPRVNATINRTPIVQLGPFRPQVFAPEVGIRMPLLNTPIIDHSQLADPMANDKVDTVTNAVQNATSVVRSAANAVKNATSAVRNAASAVKNTDNKTMDSVADKPKAAEQSIATVQMKITSAKLKTVNLQSSTTEETNSEIDHSSELEESFETYNMEECVYLKLQNVYFRVTNSAYNSLVPITQGRFCFVCDVKVRIENLLSHVDSRQHLENLQQYHFIDKYENHLLRQMYLMYHCAICNVMFSKKYLQTHLDWATHLAQIKLSQTTKRIRKKELSTGKPTITIKTQKETIFLKGTEAKNKVAFNVTIVESEEVLKKNKLIMFDGNAFKIGFDSWHSLVGQGVGYKCLLCGDNVSAADIQKHVAEEKHSSKLEQFETYFLPALIREINVSTANCVVCNSEIPNRRKNVETHLSGKKHMKNHEIIVNDSKDSLDNCDQYVVTLIKY